MRLSTVSTLCLLASTALHAQGTRLLREPSLGATEIVFAHGGDLWAAPRAGGDARRITSTPAVEKDPHVSPDGKWIAFTSNRAGVNAVYVVASDGGDPKRLTWSTAGEEARGWTRDGSQVLFSSGRVSAPTTYSKLFTIPVSGGPAKLLPPYMGLRASFAPDGKRMVVDRVSRWDVEFRSYRGGQNTPLTITNIADGAEVRIPSERTMDIYPVWMGETIYFLSDRDWATNGWSYDVNSKALKQLTHFKDADIKTMDGRDGSLVFEQDGYLWTFEPGKNEPHKLAINARGDMPWAMSHWTDVTRNIASASIGPNAKRAVFESRGEIFTIPADKGDARNLTRSPGKADRAPAWSPDGNRLAWFSDAGEGYQLLIGDADGLGTTKSIAIGDSKFAWNPEWSPDGKSISFVDNKARIRVVDVAATTITTADTGGAATDRGAMQPHWSPDSKWLAYSKSFPNQFHRVMIWSRTDGKKHAITDALADATDPVWDHNGKWLYLLASTDLGLQSGWADLGSLTRRKTNGVYVALLRNDEPTPFTPESDEEKATRDTAVALSEARGLPSAAPRDTTRTPRTPDVRIDFDRFDRRIIALSMPVRDYSGLIPGAAGTVFVAERIDNQLGVTLHKWDMAKRKSEVFSAGVTRVSASKDGKKFMWQQGTNWSVVGTDAAPRPGATEGALRFTLNAQLDPKVEWQQIFDEAWRIERDFFYDSKLHGADWSAVKNRYEPLIPHIEHRTDLTYILDQLGGELSVGHSFVGGGDFPTLDSNRVGALGADLVADGDKWKIARIFTSESWNPGLRAPLDQPGVKAHAGDYLLEVNGIPVTTRDEPWKALDGTADRQTVLKLSDRASGEGAWAVTVLPVRNEAQLRQRAWIEDNRRRVDSLSGGTLAYVWVPNTSQPAITAFDRYYFAQQDKKGAVIDERFNGGGLLDDYMVNVMSRKPVGGVTDFVPGAKSLRLPASGIWGPKVLVTNEMAGSGGDYFPWVFHELKVGPLIGTRTWGGLVNASVPYALVDGGTITSPAQAVFGSNGFIAEGVGVPPDVEVLQESAATMKGRDPQLERAVQEAMKLAQEKPVIVPKTPTEVPVRARRPQTTP